MVLLEASNGRLYLEAVLSAPALTRRRHSCPARAGRSFFLLLFSWICLPPLARAAESPRPACALFKACALGVTLSTCPPEQSKPVEGIRYDEARCGEPRDLLAHGLSPISEMGALVYPFLGGRYRVVYDLQGEAPISEARFDYLAEDLPLAAHLATRFSKTKYVMRHNPTNPRRFFASRADKLTGEAELLFVDAEAKRRAYYGWGSSKFGPWRLRGSAYVDLRVRPTPAGLAYDVRIRTAPVNGMVNAIMSMGLFRGYVIGQIEDTMKDLVGAAHALSANNLKTVLGDPGFTPEEREKIRALSALP